MSGNRKDWSRNNNRYSGNRSNYNRKPRDSRKPQNPHEKVIRITYEEDRNKNEEYIANILFDVMYAISQEEKNKIILKSQGKAINTCAQLVIALEKRFKDQFIDAKKNIRINSRIFDNDNHRGNQKGNPKQKKRFNPNKIRILSYLDVYFYIN